MRTFILAICLSYFVLSLRADALRDRMDAYVRRYADSDFFRGCARDQRRSDHLRERVRVAGSGFAGSQFAANQVSDRVTLEADDSGGNFVIGGGEEA